jgi:molybdate transport system ATP-binding protein
MLVVDVYKQWEDFCLRVKFAVDKGELLVILGSSGCGKSTLLNLIAGVIDPDGGEIAFDEDVFYSVNQVFPIHKRKIGYIQQKSNLFPHLTVKQNILYGVKEKSHETDMKNLIELLGIEEIMHKKPSEISGGQQQRVSLARALITNPKMILLDEPFSALDNIRRLNLRETINRIKQKFQIPMIFVTHDLEEAYALGDRIAVMDQGVFLQVGSKEEVFRHPKNTVAAHFVGMRNILKGNVKDADGKEIVVDVSGMILKIPYSNTCYEENISLGIRPEDIMYVKKDKAIGKSIRDNIFQARVKKKNTGPENCKLVIQIENNGLLLEMILPNYIVQKYKIKEEKQIQVALKKNAVAILKQ